MPVSKQIKRSVFFISDGTAITALDIHYLRNFQC
jgi:regulator of PEP synthase PpsR (kinase-PPPase family)